MLGCDALVLFKDLYKIAAVVKAAAVGGLSDGDRGGCQEVAGSFDAVVI